MGLAGTKHSGMGTRSRWDGNSWLEPGRFLRLEMSKLQVHVSPEKSSLCVSASRLAQKSGLGVETKASNLTFFEPVFRFASRVQGIAEGDILRMCSLRLGKRWEHRPLRLILPRKMTPTHPPRYSEKISGHLARPEAAKPGPGVPAGVPGARVAARRTYLPAEPPFLKWRGKGPLRLRSRVHARSRDVIGHVTVGVPRRGLLDMEETD